MGVLLYTPLLVLFLSHSPGDFTLASLGWPVALCGGVLGLSWLLAARWPRALRIADLLLGGPVLYVLLAATFVPVHGNVLDGTETHVATADRLLHDGLMGLCVAVALLAVAVAPVRATFTRVTTLLGLFAVGASGYMAVATLPLRAPRPDPTQAGAVLSAHHNVIVLMLDMLQGGFAAEYFRRHPAAAADFEGFTLYRNTASFAPFTALSYAGFMAGGYPAPRQIAAGHVRDAVYYPDNVIEDMVARGYAPRYFSIIPYEYPDAQVVRLPDDLGLTRKDNFLLSALTLRGRYLPYAYLPFGLTYMPWMQREFGMFSKTDARDSLGWFVHHVQVAPALPKGFVWFHSLATHQPIRFDAEGRFSMARTPDDVHGEVAYVFGQLRAFVARLQQLQVYDDALIIILSDHGYNILQKMTAMPVGAAYARAPFGNGLTVGQYEPLVLVKRPGAHGPLHDLPDAVTLLDLRKSLREFTAPGSGAALPGFNFLGDAPGSPTRTVPVIRFVGSAFDPSDDFTDLTHWQRDTLQLPFREHYPGVPDTRTAAGAPPAAAPR